MTSTPAEVSTSARVRRHTWVPFVAAAAGAVLVLKATLVMATDDGVPTAAGVLYLLGLLLGVVSAVGAGLRRRAVGARFAVALAGVLLLLVWVMALGDALKPVVGLATDSEAVQAEVTIALAGIGLLTLAWWGLVRDTGQGPDESEDAVSAPRAA